MSENWIRNHRKIVISLKKRIGDPPTVVGLCGRPKDCNSCNICRAARTRSKLYMSHLYASWSVESILSFIDTCSHFESNISGEEKDDKIQLLHDYFVKGYEVLVKNAEDKMVEYNSMKIDSVDSVDVKQCLT
jgi:hypothetical protein